MIKKLIIIVSYLFKNNIEKSLEKNITKLECNYCYCEKAFKLENTIEICKINNKLYNIRIRDEL